MKTIAVIGGGVSGISTGLELLKENFDVTIFEKQNSLGGLSSSLESDKFVLDFGPHILSVKKSSDVFNDINQIMKDDIIEIFNVEKYSKTFYQDQVWDTFPNLSTIIQNSGKIALIKGFKGFIRNKKKKFENNNSKDYLIDTFGESAYNEWFRPFIFNRFTNQNPPLEMIEKIFPSKSLKTILESRINTNSTKNKKIEDEESHFYFRYGMKSLVEKIKEKIEERDGKIKTNCEIQNISHGNTKTITFLENNKIEKMNVDAIVYTIPIPHCMKWFNNEKVEKQGKKFHCLMIFLMIDSIQNKKFWIMNVFDPKKIFYRISQQNFLSKETIPPNKSALCIEIRCSEEDEIWNKNDEDIICKVKSELESMNFFNLNNIENQKLLRLKNIYPLEGFEENHDQLKQIINLNQNEFAIGSVEGDTGRLTDMGLNDDNAGINGINRAISNAKNVVKRIKNNE
jgi:protoporphyrinogen oxidase